MKILKIVIYLIVIWITVSGTFLIVYRRNQNETTLQSALIFLYCLPWYISLFIIKLLLAIKRRVSRKIGR